jgi:hypothetical protein
MASTAQEKPKGALKAIAIKTPPQTPDDTKRLD